MTAKGKAIRLNTQIDIPIEIGLPHFIQDDHIDEDGPIYGNFKLSLQSVVCHRGNSVSSGHYIALARGTNTMLESAVGSTDGQDAKHWMRFDDLASKRITLIDIEQALKEETPYLLFYQIVPIEGDPGHITEGEQPAVYGIPEARDSGVAGLSRTSLSLTTTREDLLSSGRPSFEIPAPDSPRGRPEGLEARRSSIMFAEPAKVPEELSVQDQKSLQPSSRPTSQTRRNSSHTRSSNQASDILARSLSRLSLTGRKSKEVLPEVGDAQALVRGVSNSTMEVAQSQASSRKGSTVEPAQAHVAARREGKREKSKSRLSRVSGFSGKAKSEKPDRECSVM